MNFRLTTAVVALGCATLAACYPYDESARRPRPRPQREASVSSQDQQKLKEQRERMKEKEEARKRQESEQQTASNPDPIEPTTTPPPPPPKEEKREFVFASKVPGKEGFVFSPYNNKVVDVRGIPSGTLVSDPTYPESEKKYFRVP